MLYGLAASKLPTPLDLDKEKNYNYHIIVTHVTRDIVYVENGGKNPMCHVVST